MAGSQDLSVGRDEGVDWREGGRPTGAKASVSSAFPFPRTVRGTLLLLLLVVLVPTVVVQVIVHYRELVERRAQEFRSNLELARGVGAAFESYVRDILHQELSLGQALTAREGLPYDQASQLLTVDAREYPSVRHFSWADPQGLIIASSLPEAVGVRVADRSYVQEILQGRPWAVSDLLVGRASGEVTFVVARAVRGSSGALVGIVMGLVDPQRLDEVLPVDRAGEGAISILDRQGRVVYRYPEVALTWAQRDVADLRPLLTPALAGHDATATFVSPIDGREWMGGFVPVHSFGWVASGSQPVAEVMAPLVRDLVYDLGLLMLVAVAAFATALAVGRKLTVPMGRLAEHTLAVGRGELLRAIEIDGPAELRQLGDAFNRMAEEVRSREKRNALLHQETQFERARWQATVEGMLDPVTVCDARGRAIYMNPAYSRLVSRWIEPDLPLDQHAAHYQLYRPDGTPFAPEELPLQRAALQDEDVGNVEVVQRTSEREERILVWNASPLHDADGRLIGAVAVGRDVTQQRWVEAERRRDQEAQSFLAEASALLASSLVYETTLTNLAKLATERIADWCVIDVAEEDGAVRRLVVACADPAKADLARELVDFSPSDPLGQRGVAEVLRSGRSEIYPDLSEAVPAPTDRDPGCLESLRRVAVRSAMIVPMVARDRTLGAITLVTEDSGRCYGPTDLALAEDLARRAALAVDNARLYQEAEEAVRVRNEFFYNISHDLKNPLTAVKGMAQLLMRRTQRLEVAGAEPLMSGLSTIEAAATKMNSQINEVLDLARLQSGQNVRLDRRPMELVALVRQVVGEQQQGTDRHKLTIQSSPLELIGLWDPVRLERVVANLVSNAIKFSPHGGEITVRIAREEISDEPWALLEVRDRGIGIPAADLPFVFERFRRAENVAGRISGTGIGLASVRQIVELHGGTVVVGSKEGEGAAFTVRLPLPPAMSSDDGRPSEPSSLNRS